VSRRRHGCDELRAFGGIVVGEEAERRDAARPVAGGAFPVDDRRDVVRESGGRHRPERAEKSRKVHRSIVPWLIVSRHTERQN